MKWDGLTVKLLGHQITECRQREMTITYKHVIVSLVNFVNTTTVQLIIDVNDILLENLLTV